jgi:hypothetical protein
MEEAPVQRKAKFKKQTLSQSQTDVVNDLQKRYFDDDNNFIDYFIEVGVKPEIFKNKVLYECDDPDEINQYLIPQIITKFPNFDKKTVVIENSMIHQIFPQGFKLHESETRPEPNFYCLVLDNQLYSAIYTRKYLACLIIYESIEDYKVLYDKFKKEDDKFLSVVKNIMADEINNNAKKKYKNFYIPKCLSLVSVHPYIDKYEEILRTIYDIVISGSYSNIFIDQIIEKLIIETPKIPRGLKRILLKFPNNEIELTETKMNQFPSVNVNLAYTFDILSYNNIIEIYKYLLYETKLIFFSEDLYTLTNVILSFLFLLTPFNYQFQIVSILSKELYNFVETISPYIFGINEKYTENFFSKHKISVEDTTICIIDIDKDNYFLIAPGGVLNQKEFPDYPKKLRKKLEDKIKVYLINKKKKRSISQYYPNQTNATSIEENFSRCSTYKNCSFMSVLTCVSDLSTESVTNRIHYKSKNNDNEEIQKIFSKFMINLLKDYPKFLTKDYSVNRDISQSIKDMIDLKSYLNLYSNGEKCFYSKIFSTQMFMEFIYKRMMPKDCNEKVEVLFIEEKIQEKLNEKNLLSKIGKSKNAVQYILLHCKEYDYDEKIITIDLTGEKGLTYGLKCYLLNNKLLLSTFLNRGYNIKIDNDSFDITFTYNIFPSLLSDKLFILNIEEYQKEHFPFYKNIEEINARIVNKIAFKFIQEKNRINNSESQNDLYLCYLIVWSMVFWYTEEDEKDDRFIEMLGVLEKVDEHDVKIFEMLFKTLVKYSKDENVILLYKKFIHLRLNPSWDMFSLVSKIIKKKQNIDRKNKLLHQDTNMEKIKLLLYNSKKANEAECFPNRTFKTSNKDDIIFSNKILFYSYFLCKNCKKITNLGEICSKLKDLKTEKDTKGISRLKCNFKNKEGKICASLIEQPFKFKLGEELFNQKMSNNQIHRYLTSVPKSVILLSPTEIKKNLLEITTNKKKEEKFDVENFKTNYPDIFWSLLWYFNLHNIDKNFMLPYQSPLKNVKFKRCDNDADNNIQYIYNRFASNKDDENNEVNEVNDKKVFRLNAKECQIKICKKKNEIKTYKTEDLCIQNIYEFCIIENLGFYSNRSLYIYSNNISFNEMPILSYDKDNNSVFSGSIYFNDSESSTRISLVRDSVMSCQQVPKRSTINQLITGPSKISKSGPGLSDIGYKLGGRDSLMTKCIVFEESDDSLDN